MALGLACSQGWWRSWLGGRHLPSAARAAPGVSGSRGSLGAGSGAAGSPRMEPRPRKTRATTATPDPKGWLAGLGREGRLRFAFRRLSQTENSGIWSGSSVDGFPPCLPHPPVVSPLIWAGRLDLSGLRAPYLVFLVIWGLESRLTKPGTGRSA